MNILACDTTSKDSSISILHDDVVVLEYNFSADDNLSALFLPSLDFLLKSLRLQIADFEGVGIAVGPGLFTGIRVGLAALKGILFGRNTPLVPVVTLQALAYKCLDSREPIAALIDARRGDVYLGCYRSDDGWPAEVREPALVPCDQIQGVLTSTPRCAFVGSGADLHKEYLKKRFPDSKFYFRSHFLASEIGKIAYHRLLRGDFVTDPQSLAPLYLRPPDAEAKIDRKESAGEA